MSKFNPWRYIDSAPKDRLIEVYAVDPNWDDQWSLPNLVCHCQWHPDAGFCVDELRVPYLWREVE